MEIVFICMFVRVTIALTLFGKPTKESVNLNRVHIIRKCKIHVNVRNFARKSC